MSNHESLLEAMHLSPESETARWMEQRGIAIADEETMSQAIHDVYCGATADHDHPNEKDHEQAMVIIAALQKHAAGGPPA
jgi:hypothetical protein